MALPTSGTISIQDILREMGRTNRSSNLNDLAKEWYVVTRKSKFNATTHKLSDWRGESWNNYGDGGYTGNPSNPTITFNRSIGTL